MHGELGVEALLQLLIGAGTLRRGCLAVCRSLNVCRRGRDQSVKPGELRVGPVDIKLQGLFEFISVFFQLGGVGGRCKGGKRVTL